jgi:hypothetical protein
MNIGSSNRCRHLVPVADNEQPNADSYCASNLSSTGDNYDPDDGKVKKGKAVPVTGRGGS